MRFALYYSPGQNSPFHQSGASWLGYDAFIGTPREQPGHGLLTGKTEIPAHYGFHATLKPPFTLRENCRLEALEAATESLAASHQTVTIEKLVLRQIKGFLALVPDVQGDALSKLADDCVTGLDSFRSPLDADEQRRRKDQGLTPRQTELLEAWGYPYVFDEFHFHITLTRRLTTDEMPDIIDLAARHFAPFINQPLDISSLTLLAELAPGSAFIIQKQFPLLGKSGAS